MSSSITPEDRKKMLLDERLFRGGDPGIVSTNSFDPPSAVIGNSIEPPTPPPGTIDSVPTVTVGPFAHDQQDNAAPQSPNDNGSLSDSRASKRGRSQVEQQQQQQPLVDLTDQNSRSKSNLLELRQPPSSSGQETNGADDMQKRRSPKLKRPIVVDGDGPVPADGAGVVGDTNSREGKKVKLITNYFVTKTGHAPSENPWAAIPNGINNTAASASASSGGGSESGGLDGVSSSGAGAGAGRDRDQNKTTPVQSMAEKRSASSRNLSASSSSSAHHSGNNNNTGDQSVAAAAAVINELKRALESNKISKEQAEGRVQRLEAEIKDYDDRLSQERERNSKLAKAVEETYRKMAYQQFRQKREQLALNSVRVGRLVPMRVSATQMADMWEDGYSAKELHKRSAVLLERKEELEQRRKRTLTLKRAAKKGALGGEGNDAVLEAITAAGAGGLSSSEQMAIEVDLDLATEMEVIKSHLEQLKRDESALAEEKRLLESEKAVHQKDLKRCQAEERSRFYRDLPLLHKRYVLQSLLGKGGFSEVWKALDVLELREVAVKVHQLNPSWTEERKQSYIRHVTREYLIHKELHHPRIVHLYDVFEIDINSFATVLEYCEGIDLDEKLKRQRCIPEKDARAVFMQIMSGLRYLNKPLNFSSTGSSSGPVPGTLEEAAGGSTGVGDDGNQQGGGGGAAASGGGGGGGGGQRRMSIIHFDLKPANILFDEMGDVKITDFGLSKVIDETNEGTSMELTSQGAGTYWYLPPECFAKGPQPPRISSKVDVWSAGVIFYQMLYGIRPFGEGKSQETVWSEGLVLNSKVEFPSSPNAAKVSEEAKDLIRACLTSDQKYRPDVTSVCQHPYLKNK